MDEQLGAQVNALQAVEGGCHPYPPTMRLCCRGGTGPQHHAWSLPCYSGTRPWQPACGVWHGKLVQSVKERACTRAKLAGGAMGGRIV